MQDAVGGMMGRGKGEPSSAMKSHTGWPGRCWHLTTPPPPPPSAIRAARYPSSSRNCVAVEVPPAQVADAGADMEHRRTLPSVQNSGALPLQVQVQHPVVNRDHPLLEIPLGGGGSRSAPTSTAMIRSAPHAFAWRMGSTSSTPPSTRTSLPIPRGREIDGERAGGVQPHRPRTPPPAPPVPSHTSSPETQRHRIQT